MNKEDKAKLLDKVEEWFNNNPVMTYEDFEKEKRGLLMNKCHDFVIDLNIAMLNIEGKKEEAKEKLKEQFEEKHDIELVDEEIKELKGGFNDRK